MPRRLASSILHAQVSVKQVAARLARDTHQRTLCAHWKARADELRAYLERLAPPPATGVPPAPGSAGAGVGGPAPALPGALASSVSATSTGSLPASDSPLHGRTSGGGGGPPVPGPLTPPVTSSGGSPPTLAQPPPAGAVPARMPPSQAALAVGRTVPAPGPPRPGAFLPLGALPIVNVFRQWLEAPRQELAYRGAATGPAPLQPWGPWHAIAALMNCASTLGFLAAPRGLHTASQCQRRWQGLMYALAWHAYGSALQQSRAQLGRLYARHLEEALRRLGYAAVAHMRREYEQRTAQQATPAGSTGASSGASTAAGSGGGNAGGTGGAGAPAGAAGEAPASGTRTRGSRHRKSAAAATGATEQGAGASTASAQQQGTTAGSQPPSGQSVPSQGQPTTQAQGQPGTEVLRVQQDQLLRIVDELQASPEHQRIVAEAHRHFHTMLTGRAYAPLLWQLKTHYRTVISELQRRASDVLRQVAAMGATAPPAGSPLDVAPPVRPFLAPVATAVLTNRQTADWQKARLHPIPPAQQPHPPPPPGSGTGAGASTPATEQAVQAQAQAVRAAQQQQQQLQQQQQAIMMLPYGPAQPLPRVVAMLENEDLYFLSQRALAAQFRVQSALATIGPLAPYGPYAANACANLTAAVASGGSAGPSAAAIEAALANTTHPVGRMLAVRYAEARELEAQWPAAAALLARYKALVPPPPPASAPLPMPPPTGPQPPAPATAPAPAPAPAAAGAGAGTTAAAAIAAQTAVPTAPTPGSEGAAPAAAPSSGAAASPAIAPSAPPKTAAPPQQQQHGFAHHSLPIVADLAPTALLPPYNPLDCSGAAAAPKEPGGDAQHHQLSSTSATLVAPLLAAALGLCTAAAATAAISHGTTACASTAATGFFWGSTVEPVEGGWVLGINDGVAGEPRGDLGAEGDSAHMVPWKQTTRPRDAARLNSATASVCGQVRLFPVRVAASPLPPSLSPTKTRSHDRDKPHMPACIPAPEPGATALRRDRGRDLVSARPRRVPDPARLLRPQRGRAAPTPCAPRRLHARRASPWQRPAHHPAPGTARYAYSHPAGSSRAGRSSRREPSHGRCRCRCCRDGHGGHTRSGTTPTATAPAGHRDSAGGCGAAGWLASRHVGDTRPDAHGWTRRCRHNGYDDYDGPTGSAHARRGAHGITRGAGVPRWWRRWSRRRRRTRYAGSARARGSRHRTWQGHGGLCETPRRCLLANSSPPERSVYVGMVSHHADLRLLACSPCRPAGTLLSSQSWQKRRHRRLLLPPQPLPRAYRAPRRRVYSRPARCRPRSPSLRCERPRPALPAPPSPQPPQCPRPARREVLAAC